MRRRRLVWFIAFLFALVSCWWTTFFPYNAERLYSAIPVSADLVLEVDDLAEHWDDIFAHPAASKIAGQFKISDKQFQKVSSGKDLQKLIRALASRKTLVATLPCHSGGSTPTVIIASWAGTKGQVLEWLLPIALKGKAETKVTSSGEKIWLLKKKLKDKKISVSFVEGVFLLCISRDPAGVQYPAERVLRQSSIIPMMHACMVKRESEKDSAPVMVYSQSVKWPGSQAFSVDFDNLNDGKMTGRVKWEYGNPLAKGEVSDGYAASSAQILGIVGDVSGAAAIAPYDYFSRVIRNNDIRQKYKPLFEILGAKLESGAPVMIGMCRPEYSGRVQLIRGEEELDGLKVPSFYLCARLKKDIDISKDISKTIDSINMHYRLGLLATEREMNGHKVYSMDLVSKRFFSGMSVREKPAMTVLGDWLILASSMDALEAVMKEDRGNTGLTELDFNESNGGAWLDLQATESSLVTLTGVYELLVRVGQVRRGGAFRQLLSSSHMFVQTFLDMETCLFRVEPVNGGAELVFHIGVAGD